MPVSAPPPPPADRSSGDVLVAWPALALAGPTASGKTALALAIAEELRDGNAAGGAGATVCTGIGHGDCAADTRPDRTGAPSPHLSVPLAALPPIAVEIISVDSALVYRGMDIGTAKPSATERAAVPHHLIDIRDPTQPYSAADFVADATRLIAQIQARGALPLLVGGTLLYFKALLDGLDAMPPADVAVRAALEAEASARGWPALHAELQRVDPMTAARLPVGDSQRIQRALEVYRLTGRPLSRFHTRGTAGDRVPGPLQPQSLIALEPADRAWLHARIAQRFDTMLAHGFLDEVRALQARTDLPPDAPALRCVGYRQALETFRGKAPANTLRDRGVFATRQLAKRQLTWLRGMPQRTVVVCDAPDAQRRTVAAVRRLLAAHRSSGTANGVGVGVDDGSDATQLAQPSPEAVWR